MNFINTSVHNIYTEIYFNTSSYDKADTNISYAHISDSNLKAINLIKSFASLEENWDTYHALAPDSNAIHKAISFILWLSEYNIDVFFVAPSPNGEIVVEIKKGNANVEFEFSNDSEDYVYAIHEGKIIADDLLNETTQFAYIKWLICPDGDCPPDL